MEYKYIISYDQVNLYVLNGLLRSRVAIEGYRKIFDLRDKIDNIVRYSNISYPPVSVIPESRIVVHEDGVRAIVYANINFRMSGGYVRPIVEVYLPFLLYARGDLKTLVLAHEFLHYVYLAIRYVSSDYLINPLIYTGNLSGRYLLEEIYTVHPSKVFSNKRFVTRLLNIGNILDKSRLANTINRRWIERGLPNRVIPVDDFRVKLSMSMWSNMYFPEDVLRKARVLIGDQH